MGEGPPPPLWLYGHQRCTFFLNTRITKSCGLNGGGGGGGAVLSTLVKNSWCGQSSKGPRGQTSLGVCWVNSQAKVEQISSNFGYDYLLIRHYLSKYFYKQERIGSAGPHGLQYSLTPLYFGHFGGGWFFFFFFSFLFFLGWGWFFWGGIFFWGGGGFFFFFFYSAVQYSTVQYSTVQYSTVQYSTVQYSTVQSHPTPKVGGVEKEKEKKKSIWRPTVPPPGTMGKKKWLFTHQTLP